MKDCLTRFILTNSHQANAVGPVPPRRSASLCSIATRTASSKICISAALPFLGNLKSGSIPVNAVASSFGHPSEESRPTGCGTLSPLLVAALCHVRPSALTCRPSRAHFLPPRSSLVVPSGWPRFRFCRILPPELQPAPLCTTSPPLPSAPRNACQRVDPSGPERPHRSMSWKRRRLRCLKISPTLGGHFRPGVGVGPSRRAVESYDFDAMHLGATGSGNLGRRARFAPASTGGRLLPRPCSH